MNEIIIFIICLLCVIIGVLRYKEIRLINDISTMREILIELHYRQLSNKQKETFEKLETWEEKLKYIKTLPKA